MISMNDLDPDPSREGLQETPERFKKMMQQLTSNSRLPEHFNMKSFGDGAPEKPMPIAVEGLRFYSVCEHHLALIIGSATIIYKSRLNCKRVFGLSKFGRLVDHHAKRLQTQERMTQQILDNIMWYTFVDCAAVILKARHMCMESRGISQPGAVTTTSAIAGHNFSCIEKIYAAAINKEVTL